MQTLRKVDPNELMQAINTCDQLFESMEDSYQNLESSFNQLAKKVDDQKQSHLMNASRLAAIINVLPSGVVILNGNGCVAQYNPAAEDMLGVPLEGEQWCEVIARAFSPKDDDGHDISLKDGRIVNISTTPLGDEPGQVILLHDVTKTREQQRAQMRDKRLAALGEMAASLAHQIRTPLSSALLYASHLKNSALDNERKEKMTSRVISQIKNLEVLVNDMLMFAKGDCVDDERFSIGDFVASMNQSATDLVADTEIEFNVINEVASGWLKGNQKMLLSSAMNLVENAIQAMEGKGLLTLRVQPSAVGSIDVMVIDNGCGISPEQQERIFEPFYTTRSTGTGLGLAVVRVVAQAHHGDAWVFSKQGHGSTFGLRLPVFDERQLSNKTFGKPQLDA